MTLKKLFQYGLMATCLFGNAIAMNETLDTPRNVISRHQSLLDIKAASETALAESREFHIFLGANPSETHVVELQAAEEKHEREEGIKAPIRLFFVNASYELYGEQTSSAKTPILHADFNKEESWNTILKALMLGSDPFNGVFDKIYFDASTAKAANWDKEIFSKIAILLKSSGELYIPSAKLASQSSFCDSEIEPDTPNRQGPSNYRLTLEANKDPAQQDNFNRPYLCSFNPENISTPLFLKGMCVSSYGMYNGKLYKTNNLNLVYDTTFQFSEITNGPLKFETFESGRMYPNIGMDYRQEPKDIIEQHIRINSFIKITLDGAEKKEAQEIALPISIESATKENMTHESGYELSSLATSPEITIEKESITNEKVLELSSKEVPSREGYREIKLFDITLEKAEAEKTTFKAPNAVISPEPVLSPKPTIIHSTMYCPNLYRKITKNAEAIEKIYYDESHNLQDRNSRNLLLEIRRELREAEEIIDKIEDPLTTPQDRALVAGIFAPDRLEFMQRYIFAAQKYPKLSGWLQKIGFAW